MIPGALGAAPLVYHGARPRWIGWLGLPLRKAIQAIANAITPASARVVTLAERRSSNPILWVHSVGHCNVIDTSIWRYNHALQPQERSFMAFSDGHFGNPSPERTDLVLRWSMV
jgi:hypothetical protein